MGFSRNGHLAFMRYLPSGECDTCLSIKLQVVNLKNDNLDLILHFGGEGTKPKISSYEDLYKANEKEILEKLNKFEIIKSKGSLKLKKFPADLDGSLFKVSLKQKENIFEGLYLHGPLGKKKVLSIFKRNQTIPDNSSPAAVLGYLKSPFEKRIAILVARSTYVADSTSWDFKFVGADLTSRFK